MSPLQIDDDGTVEAKEQGRGSANSGTLELNSQIVID
jgi:hypothetical protein